MEGLIKHLKSILSQHSKSYYQMVKLDLMVLSHIDNDHIIGLLDLLEEIKNPKRRPGQRNLVEVSKMWHNSFKNLLTTAEEPMKLIAKYFLGSKV